MKEFMLGVNYWASHAGTDMWREWDEEIVEKDLKLLADNGLTVLRVFPNWRDFQPVKPAFGGGHRLREYRMVNDGYPDNPYYLDEEMLDRFGRFCRIAEKNGLKLIVGLITGWMSGRLFVPAALYEKNIYTDPTALFFQQLFVKGFVERLKDQPAIYAWDLGNECNCMDQADKREEAYSWSSVIVNAIRACDPARPVISGMHSLELEGVWNIQDQGELTDILTTHPYPFWVEHCQRTPLNHFRTLMHATAQTQYYASVGKKPCLVEELGSMGPMVCEEKTAADFLRVNLWSNWANGSPGVLWWCAFDQTQLTAPPYDWNMCERELGMVDGDRQPKPSLLCMKEFKKQLDSLQLDLPEKQTDGVCILSRGQDHWGIAYMSYLLAKQAGLTLSFAYCEQELPEVGMYFLPSVCMEVMSKKSYDRLKKKVYDGAVLYISMKDGFLTEFEEFTGLQVKTADKSSVQGAMNWNGIDFNYRKPYHIRLAAARAEVLAADADGEPVFSAASYGAGRVYFLNFPLEDMLLTDVSGLETPYYRFYEKAAEAVLEKRVIRKTNPYVGMTLHQGTDSTYAILVNYSAKEQDAGIICHGYEKTMECLFGHVEKIEPFGAVILRYCSRVDAPCKGRIYSTEVN